jgi:hypothetical protein
VPRYFDVSKRLDEAGIRVAYGPLPPRTNGLSCRLYGHMAVLLRSDLTRVEKHCTLVHEYYHLKLFKGVVFSFYDTYRLRLDGDKIEYEVRKATARRLVPFGLLRKMLHGGDEPYEMAEAFDVTLDVLLDALKLMSLRPDEGLFLG